MKRRITKNIFSSSISNCLNVEEGEFPPQQRLEISLCNHLLKEGLTNEERHFIFDENLVDIDHFDKDPYSKLFNLKLCFRIEDSIVLPKTIIPQILSLLTSGKNISSKGLTTIINSHIFTLNWSNNLISETVLSKKFSKSFSTILHIYINTSELYQLI